MFYSQIISMCNKVFDLDNNYAMRGVPQSSIFGPQGFTCFLSTLLETLLAPIAALMEPN